jgi:hypothetical protein
MRNLGHNYNNTKGGKSYNVTPRTIVQCRYTKGERNYSNVIPGTTI